MGAGHLFICQNAPASLTFYYLGELPGGSNAIPTAMNNSGTVVGRGMTAVGTTATAILFNVLNGGPNLNLDPLGSWNEARGVSDAGQIIGYEAQEALYPGRALVFDPSGGGANADIGAGKRAYAINENNQVVGGSGNGGSASAWLWNLSLGTTPALLGPGEATAVSDNGMIVGQTYGVFGPNWRATLYDSSGGGNNVDLRKLSSSDDHSFADAVNNSGQVVGASGSPGLGYTATLFSSDGSGQNFSIGASGNSYARAINHLGQAVGEENGHATIFDVTGSMNNIDLNDLVDTPKGWVLIDATGINDLGWIIGRGNFGAYLLAPADAFPDYVQPPPPPGSGDVPEIMSPAIWFVLGLAGRGIRSRTK